MTHDPPMQATTDELVTDAMIAAGVGVLLSFPEATDLQGAVAPVYLAMHEARPSPPDTEIAGLVERLHEIANYTSVTLGDSSRRALREAAAELTRISADNARMQAALRYISVTSDDYSQMRKAARAALQSKG